ncbi:MAG: LemA family protein [Desulfuromonadaceae bacterium]
MPTRNRYVILLVAVVLIIYLFARHANNVFVEEQHLLFTASGLLELEMKRREDLLARARAAVKDYNTLEEKIHIHLVELNALKMPPGNNKVRLEKTNPIFELLSEFDSLKESYPALKSKGPYVALMEDMQASGFRVITARLAYNRKVNEFNTLLNVFPYKLFARPLGFHAHPFQEGAGEKFLRNEK